MYVLDTNILVRYFISDPKDQFVHAKKIIQSGEKLFVSDLIFAETVSVLQKVYSVPKKKIVESLFLFLELPSLVLDSEVLRETLKIFREESISFADAYTIAQAIELDEDLHTFDKKMQTIYKKLKK